MPHDVRETRLRATTGNEVEIPVFQDNEVARKLSNLHGGTFATPPPPPQTMLPELVDATLRADLRKVGEAEGALVQCRTQGYVLHNNHRGGRSPTAAFCVADPHSPC